MGRTERGARENNEEATSVAQMRKKQDLHKAVIAEKGGVKFESCSRGRINKT